MIIVKKLYLFLSARIWPLLLFQHLIIQFLIIFNRNYLYLTIFLRSVVIYITYETGFAEARTKPRR